MWFTTMLCFCISIGRVVQVGVYGAPQSATQHFVHFSNTAAPPVSQPSQRVAVTIPQDPLTTGSALTRPFVSPPQSSTVPPSATTSTPRYSVQGRGRDWGYSDYPQNGPMSPGEFLPEGLLQQVPGNPPPSQWARQEEPPPSQWARQEEPPPSQWARQEDPVIPASSTHQTPMSSAHKVKSEPSYHAPAPANTASRVDHNTNALTTTTSDIPPGGSIVTEPSVVTSSTLIQGRPQAVSPTSNYSGTSSPGKAPSRPMEELTVMSPGTSLHSAPENEGMGADVLSQNSETSCKHVVDSQSSSSRGKTKIRGLTKRHKTTDAESRDDGGADDYTSVMNAERQSWASLASSDSERFTVAAPQRLDTVSESSGRNRSPSPGNVSSYLSVYV